MKYVAKRTLSPDQMDQYSELLDCRFGGLQKRARRYQAKGIGLHQGQVVGSRPKDFSNHNVAPQRQSSMNEDAIIMNYLCKTMSAHLSIPIHGYVSAGAQTPAHGGVFHSEIAVCCSGKDIRLKRYIQLKIVLLVYANRTINV